MPVFDMMETFLVKQVKLKPSFKLRLITRTLYVGEWFNYALLFINSHVHTD